MSHMPVKPLALAALLSCHLLGHANQPTGHLVVNGSATVNRFGNGVQVINSPGAIIEWGSFSIGAGQTVRFDQLTANSAVLNRVTGGRASEIFGTLQSNGRVFLINPNGILFGKGSKVDTAGFLASTLDIRNDDFLSGNYRFRCANSVACEAGVDVLNPINGRVVLQDGSEITTRQAGNGGQVWLIARDRITSEKGSKIDTPGGQVIAATAREVSVTSPSLGQMRFTLTGATNTRIDLAGDIDVARGAAGFFADTIRLAGKVSALSEKGAAGQIVAQAATDVLVEDDARLNVSGIDGADAGAVRLTAGRKIAVAGSVGIWADGGRPSLQGEVGKGGLIDFTALEIVLPAGTNDAPGLSAIHATGGLEDNGSGPSMAGTVRVNETGTFTFDSQVVSTYTHGRLVWSPVADGQGNFSFLRLDGSNQYHLDFHDAQGHYIGTLPVPINFTLEGLTKGGWVMVSYEGDEALATVQFIRADLTVAQSLKIDRFLTLGLQRRLDGGADLTMVGASGSSTDGYTVTSYDTQGAVTGTQEFADYEALYQQRFDPNTVDRQAGLIGGNFASNPYIRIANDGKVQLARANEVLKDLVTTAPFGVMPLNGAYASYYSSINEIVLLGQNQVTTTGSESGSYSKLPIVSNSLTTDVGQVGYVQGGEFTKLFDTRYVYQDDRLITCFNCENATTSTVSSSVASLMRVGGNNFLANVNVTRLSTTKADNVESGSSSSSGQQVLLTRRLTSQLVPTAQMDGGVLTPALLGIAPGQRNGAVVPPADTSPDSSTGAGPSGPTSSGPGSGSSTVPSTGPSGLSLPPPPAPITPPKSPNATPKLGSGIEASIITDPSGANGRQELLDAAADVVEHELGKAMADKFREATTPEERGVILQEAADAEVLGRELYDIVKDMDPEMSDALFEGWSVLQQAGLEQEPGVSEGLLNALTIKRDGGTNEDGSPGVPRTALEVPLSILRAEMHQAKTPEEKARVRNLMTRELLLAAREEAGKEADDTADVVLTDVAGKKTRITPKGELIRE